MNRENITLLAIALALCLSWPSLAGEADQALMQEPVEWLQRIYCARL
jgi:hypothetical protein